MGFAAPRLNRYRWSCPLQNHQDYWCDRYTFFRPTNRGLSRQKGKTQLTQKALLRDHSLVILASCPDCATGSDPTGTPPTKFPCPRWYRHLFHWCPCRPYADCCIGTTIERRTLISERLDSRELQSRFPQN